MNSENTKDQQKITIFFCFKRKKCISKFPRQYSLTSIFRNLFFLFYLFCVSLWHNIFRIRRISNKMYITFYGMQETSRNRIKSLLIFLIFYGFLLWLTIFVSRNSYQGTQETQIYKKKIYQKNYFSSDFPNCIPLPQFSGYSKKFWILKSVHIILFP